MQGQPAAGGMHAMKPRFIVYEACRLIHWDSA